MTNAGLKDLAAINALWELRLIGTHVTDAGLKDLAGLKTLEWLDLTDTKVTPDGIAERHKALRPDCKIRDNAAQP